MKNLKVIVNTKESDIYYIVLKESGEEFIKLSKSKNSLESIINYLGKENIKEII